MRKNMSITIYFRTYNWNGFPIIKNTAVETEVRINLFHIVWSGWVVRFI